MRLNAVKVLGILMINASKKEILEEIQKYLVQQVKNKQKPLVIFTPNTEQLVLAHKNSQFATVLNQADIAIPDTVGIVWASKILTKNGIENAIPGVEFMEDLVELAARSHVPIGLIGGRGNLAVDTLNCLRQKYGKLQDTWAEDGLEITMPYQTNNQFITGLAKKIIAAKTKIVFVGFGPPKQEFFIEDLAKKLSISNFQFPIILMAVGGSFDMISGRVRRAPLWMRNFGLEWLWRLILEPWRIKRQLALVEFVWFVLRAKLAS